MGDEKGYREIFAPCKIWKKEWVMESYWIIVHDAMIFH
jgi:hypothetical protein